MVHKVYECPECSKDIIMLNGMGAGHLKICPHCKTGFCIEYCHRKGILMENEPYDKANLALWMDFDKCEVAPEIREIVAPAMVTAKKENVGAANYVPIHDDNFKYIRIVELKKKYGADFKDE